MSFSEIFADLDDDQSPLLARFENLIAAVTPPGLEAMARESRRLTEAHFGRTMRLFAPLYL
ncbi:MAG: 2-iminoacetate synthase ThiH, partial [Verrucomicrobiales bacterium]